MELIILHGLLFFMLTNPFIEIKERKVEGIKVGQKIRTYETFRLDDLTSFRYPIDYVVTKIHPYHVETRRKTESRMETRCFSIGDLVVMGLMPSGGSRLE